MLYEVITELNGGFGFLQQLTTGGAASSSVYTADTAQGNDSGGFGVGGLVNIFQRCNAFQNNGAGFLLGGVGNILFQVTSTGNSTGIDSFGVITSYSIHSPKLYEICGVSGGCLCCRPRNGR